MNDFQSSRYPYNPPNGYTCFLCNTWVPNGVFHTCTNWAATPPPAPVYPTCNGCMAILYAGAHTVSHHTTSVEITKRYCGQCCPTCNEEANR